MSRDDLLLLLLALMLLAAMLLTLWQGGEGSRHGYGAISLPFSEGIERFPGQPPGPARTG